jgi:demethylmenaquinone methyltransferase/2-methoxy-6-polyprenyl-1,4-benzoquinol methylase
MVSGNDEAYQYLPDTVLKFPEGKDFLDRLRRAGFTTVKERRLTFGIATIYLGEK